MDAYFGFTKQGTNSEQVGLGKKYLAHKQLYDVQSGEKLPCDMRVDHAAPWPL